MASTSVPTDVLERAVALACRAPSYHNRQPWHWIADLDGLHLFLDPRHVVENDPEMRQALMSCGAVLDHLRVAMAAAGWRANIHRFPQPTNVEHLASIDFTEILAVADEDLRRADAITRRRTDRLPFGPITDWTAFETVLRHRLDETHAFVDVISESDRHELAFATGLTNALRLYDPYYWAVLQLWAAPFEASDDIPYDTLISVAEEDPVDVGRTSPVDLSTILVISARDSTPRDTLGCGEALSTVLLEAILAGLATCTLTHLTELLTTRHVVAELTGRALPQLLVRVGRAPGGGQFPPPTPRRAVGEVLTVNL